MVSLSEDIKQIEKVTGEIVMNQLTEYGKFEHYSVDEKRIIDSSTGMSYLQNQIQHKNWIRTVKTVSLCRALIRRKLSIRSLSCEVSVVNFPATFNASFNTNC